jgi:hypothetical protein
MFASLNPKPLMLRDAHINGRVSALTTDTSGRKLREFSLQDLPSEYIGQARFILLWLEAAYVLGTLATGRLIGRSTTSWLGCRATLSAWFISGQGVCVPPPPRATCTDLTP